MMHRKSIRLWPLLVVALALTGCYKYKSGQALSNPAYLRVFNSIPYEQTALNAQTYPFLCFLMDPTFDASGAPVGGTVVGDWLQLRQLYSMSYAADAGTALNAGSGQYSNQVGSPDVIYVTNANYEYPGKVHVPTAPAMNGLDLSAWAQVPSGKHRLMFVVRPQSNTAFGDLAATLRSKIIIDTTVDLTAGNVFTLEAVETNIDSNKYGAYLRNEQFVHQSFDPGRLYSVFYNLGGAPSFLTTNPSYPDFNFYADTLTIAYSYRIFDDTYSDPNPGLTTSPPVTTLATANNVYLGTVIRGRDDLSTYMPMPFLTRSYFFNQQNILRAYWEAPSDSTGTMPYVSFDFTRTVDHPGSKLYPELECSADPATFNSLNPDLVNASIALNETNFINAFNYQVSLFQVMQSDTSLNFFPTINVFEIVYDRIYLMQLERQFEKVPD